jgi:hypothetical protein
MVEHLPNMHHIHTQKKNWRGKNSPRQMQGNTGEKKEAK